MLRYFAMMKFLEIIYHAREKEAADNSVYSIVTISDAFVICQPYF